jgi:hypothetical protein
MAEGAVCPKVEKRLKKSLNSRSICGAMRPVGQNQPLYHFQFGFFSARFGIS